MKILQKSNLLLVTKNEGTEVSSDIYMVKDNSDTNLLTCDVVNWNNRYNTWETIIVWQYSLYKLIYKGTNYYFVSDEDVLGTIEE